MVLVGEPAVMVPPLGSKVTVILLGAYTVKGDSTSVTVSPLALVARTVKTYSPSPRALILILLSSLLRL